MVKTKDMRKYPSTGTGSSKNPGNCGAKWDKSKADSDNEGESELLALQRTFLHLEAARKAQEREARENIRRQRLLIGSLSAEQEDLLSSLAGLLPDSTRVNPLTQAIRDKHLQSDGIDDLMAQEKDNLACLEKEIWETQKKIDKERRESSSKDDLTRKIQKLTTRLEKTQSKYSCMVSTNSKLRQDIDTMRGERQTFLQLHNKLQRALLATRHEKQSVLEEAIENMEIREEARVRAIRSHDQRVKDCESHVDETRELQRMLCHTLKMEQFLQDKTKVRQHDKGFLKAEEKRELQERESKAGLQVQLNDYEVAVEKIGDIVALRTKRRAREGQLEGGAADRSTPLDVIEDGEERRRPLLWEMVSRRRSTLVGPMFRAAAGGGGEAERRGRRLTEHRRRSTLLLGLFSEEQERLRELARRALEEESRGQHTGPSGFDAELFYTVYMEREDGNFALFNYILEQSRMIEETTRDVEQLRQRINEEKAAAERRLREERGRELELKLQQAVQSSGKLQADVEEGRRILSLVKSGVEAVARAAGLQSPGTVIGGEWTHDTVTRAILSLLGQTELRTTDLLTARHYQAHRSKDSERAAGISLASAQEIFPHIVPQVHIQPPSTSLHAEAEDTEEEFRPLSREELLKTLVARKEV